jgi:catalase
VEKIAQFDRERVPKKVVHARGASAKLGLVGISVDLYKTWNNCCNGKMFVYK